MNKIFYSSLVSAAVLSILAVNLLFASPGKEAVKTFSGRVIYIADKYLEVKRGKTEALIYITEDTKFISQNGQEESKDIIKICQYVDVYYNLEKEKKLLTKIVIKKESDCFK